MRRGLRAIGFGAILLATTSGANAAPISLADLNNALPGLETEMESFFDITVGATASLLTNITFLNVIAVPDPADYLSIGSFTEQEDLLEAVNNVIIDVPPSPIVTAFIVDTVSFCGSSNSGFVGCADQPGHLMYLEGGFLLGAFGAELFGHELGHNLGLPHISSTSNLLHSNVNNSVGNPGLTEAQLITLNTSPLIVGGTVTIQPILITAPVPLPPAALLLALPAVLMVVKSGRRRPA